MGNDASGENDDGGAIVGLCVGKNFVGVEDGSSDGDPLGDEKAGGKEGKLDGIRVGL